MILKPISVALAVAVVLNILLLPQTVCAAGITYTSGQTLGTPVDSIDNLKLADASMDQCAPRIKRHFYQQIRHRAPATTTTTQVTNTSSTSTETLAPQVISSPAVAPVAPTTVLQTVAQPAVIEQPVTQPVVVVEHRHHYLWPLALLAAAGIATAIAVPIACSGGGHHANYAAYQQNLLLSETRSTP